MAQLADSHKMVFLFEDEPLDYNKIREILEARAGQP